MNSFPMLSRRVASTSVRVIVPAAAALVVTFIVTMLAILPYAQAMGQRVVDRINEDPNRTSLVAMLGLAVLPIFVVLFVGAAVWAGITAFVADGVTQGRPTSLARAAGASVRRLPTVVVILFGWLLAGVVAVLAAPVFVLGGLLGLLVTPVVRRTSFADRWPAWRVLALLAVPFAVAIAGVIRTAFAAPAALLDGLGIRAAVRRGWECTRGSILGPALVLLLAACISFGANALTVWLTAGFDGSAGLRVAIQFVIQLLVSPLPIVALVVLYRAESPGAPVPADGLDTQPLRGSGTRQVAGVSAAALVLQLIVFMPSQGLVLAADSVPVDSAPIDSVQAEPTPTVPADSTPTPISPPIAASIPRVAAAAALVPSVVADVFPDKSLVNGDPAKVVAGDPVTLSGQAWIVDPNSEGGGPTGELILKVDGTEVARGVLNGFLQDSRIEIPYTFALGTHTVTVVYEPDGSSLYAAGSDSITVVAQYESTTTVTAPTTQITFGNDVTIAAEVASANGTPEGVVRFTGFPEGSIEVGVVGGRAEFTTSQLPPDTTTIVANYSHGSAGGDHLPSNGSTTVTVKKAVTTTALTTAPTSPSAAGTNVTATVTVTANETPAYATGMVTLRESGTSLGSAPLIAGVATFDLALAPGAHVLDAEFVPDPGFMTSRESASHTVSPFNTVLGLTASPRTSVSSQPVTVTATVPAVGGFDPTGTVSFFLRQGTSVSKFATDVNLVNGTATTPAPPLLPGSYSFVAKYSGDTKYAPADSVEVEHTVNLAAVTLGINVLQSAPTFGDDLDVDVSITPLAPATQTPAGSMTLFANDVEVGSFGIAQSPISFTPTGTGTVEFRAVYSGDRAFGDATSTLDVDVAKRAVRQTSFFQPTSLEITYGDTVRLEGFINSDISKKPTGSVSLTANGLALGTAQLDPSSGHFEFTTDEITAGDNVAIYALYLGDSFFKPDIHRAPFNFRVAKSSANPVTTTDAIAPVLGDIAIVNVDFDDIGAGATGTVTFLTPQNRVLGTATIVAGTASLGITLTDSTTFVIARYNGDRNFKQQDATLIRIDATRANSSITIDDPGTIQYGDFTTLRARVEIPPRVQGGGTVTFYSSQNRVLAENVPVVNGVASIAVCGGDDAFMTAEQQVQFARTCPAGTAQLGIGTYELRATFSGNGSTNGSSTTRNVTVAIASARVELVANSSNPKYGSRLRLVATVSSTTSKAAPSTGQIDFISGKDSSGSGIRLGSAPLVNGVAVLEVTADTRLRVDADRVVAIFYGQFRMFRDSKGETPVVLDRRDVELTTFVVPLATDPQLTADLTSSVEVGIRSIDPGVQEPFTGTVTVSTADGATCSAKIDVGVTGTECQIQWKSVGTQTLTSSYSGDPVHKPGVSAPYTHIVGRQSSASQFVQVPTSVVENTTFEIEWFFDPSLTGTITVLSQPNCVDVPVSAGTCSARLDRTKVGAIDNLMYIRYSGDDNWLPHQFEFPIIVSGCYAVEVRSDDPRAGSVSIDPPTNCATDTSTGYLSGTGVAVAAVANESFEFVRWKGNPAASDSAAIADFMVTDQPEFWLATFQRSCYRVSVVPTRDETNQFSAIGRVTVEQSTLPNTNGYRDRRCDLVGGGVGFEIGTEMSVRAVAELNPAYGEHDLFYGFGTVPTGAVSSGSDDHREGTLDFVVDGPLAIPAIFGPRCRSVNLTVDPPDRGATATIVTPANCASPFGDGYVAHVDNPTVTVEVDNTSVELFPAGWFVNGTEVVEARDDERARFDLTGGDIDIVARFATCQTLTVSVDGVTTPVKFSVEDGLTRGTAVGEVSATEPPNCADGSNRYLSGTTVGLLATIVVPGATFAGWSDNVTQSTDESLQGSIVITEDDATVTGSFFLSSVCSILQIDDPGGYVDELGDTGCGDGYYLDQGKVWAEVVRYNLAAERQDVAAYDGDTAAYERALERARTFRGTQLNIGGLGAPGLFADSETRGGYAPDCFPMTCSGPVSGALYITVSVCQTLLPNFSIRIKDDPLKTVYRSSTVPASTLAFNARGVASEQPLRPWLETTDLSSGVPKYGESGQFVGYERWACESFDNTFPPDTRVAARVGATLPGLYVESWSDGASFLPVPSIFGFEYQADVTTTGTPAQQLSVNLIAECKTVVVGRWVTVEPPPNCPDGSGSYIVGTALSVTANRYLGQPTRVESSTKEWYKFGSGVIDESVGLVAGEGGSVTDYYTGLAFVDNHLTIEAKYRSEVDEDVSRAIRITKFVGGVLLAAGPALLLTVACPVCGAVIGGLAVAAFFVDLIPGTGGKATALINLINPATLFTCGSKWATNKPSPGVDSPPPGESPPETVSDQIAIDFDARILELIKFAEDTSITDPDALTLRTEMLEKTFEALADNVSIEAPTFDEDDAVYAAKAAKVLNTIKKEYPTAKAFISAFRPTAVAEISSSFKDGVRAAKETDRWTKLRGNGAPDAKASFMAAAGFAINLNDAGYFDMDELGRTNGTYQDATEAAGLDNFTDCLKNKVGAITG